MLPIYTYGDPILLHIIYCDLLSMREISSIIFSGLEKKAMLSSCELDWSMHFQEPSLPQDILNL